jgi:hypothetical protein
MTEEEFVALARKKWETLKSLEGEKSFYEYEKKFDELWVEFGRETMENSISELPKDRRKKKSLKAGTDE